MQNMKDDQQLMQKFVKIVEGYPEIYDTSLDGYRTRHAELSWEKIAERVRTELNEECTVEELKVKWKGIRSSFNRYKNKLLGLHMGTCKKYYLYDYLHFLDPFTKPKGLSSQETERMFEDCCNYADGNNESSTEFNPLDDWEADVKPDVSQNMLKEPKINILEFTSPMSNPGNDPTQIDKKIRNEDRNTDDDNEDLQFFKSILPDIKSFTTKEKRKLKMGILQLIDDVENERKKHKPNE